MHFPQALYEVRTLQTTNLSVPKQSFNLGIVEKSYPKPMIDFTTIAQEGMLLFVWTKIPVAADYIP